MTNHPFFVYGTLLPNQPNHYLLKNEIEHLEPAHLPQCTLYDMGHYPMLIEGGDSPVFGMLVTIAPSAMECVLSRLDALEGFNPQNPTDCAYQRQLRQVVLQNGRFSKPAWVYLGQMSYINRQPVIKSGDWVDYMKKNENSISTWWETITTVAGLHQLEE